MSISGRERAMLLVLCVFDVDQNAPFPVVHLIRYGLHHEGLLVALYLFTVLLVAQWRYAHYQHSLMGIMPIPVVP